MFPSPMQELSGDVEPLQDEDGLAADLAGFVAPADGGGGRHGGPGGVAAGGGGGAGRPLGLGRGGRGGGAVEGLVELAEIGEDGQPVEELVLHHVLRVYGGGRRQWRSQFWFISAVQHIRRLSVRIYLMKSYSRRKNMSQGRAGRGKACILGKTYMSFLKTSKLLSFMIRQIHKGS